MEKKTLEKLQKDFDKARVALSNATDEYMTQQTIPKARKNIGRCFKYVNSYGGSIDKWFLYLKILGIDEYGNYKCETFQKTSLGNIEIELNKHHQNYQGRAFTERDWYIPITLDEYNEARQKIVDEII